MQLPGSFNAAAVRPDERVLATGSRDGFVEVQDASALRTDGAQRLIERIPMGSKLSPVQNVAFANNASVWVTSEDGSTRLYTFNPDQLVELGRQRVTRTFTDEECTTFTIDPSPNLEDVRDGSS